MLLLAAFFLVRPLFDGLPVYRPRLGERTYDYWPLVLATFVPFAFALRESERGMRISLRALVVTAAVVYLAFVPTAPQQSQDVYQYLVYGDMAAHGVSPYSILPVEYPSRWLPYSAWRDTASVYGPVWTAVSQLAVVASRTVTGALFTVKAIAGALALLAAYGAHRVAESRPGGFSPTFSFIAIGLNPLVVVSSGLGAHSDVAIAAAFVGAVAAHRRGRPGLVTGLLTAATLVKPYAGVVLIVWLLLLGRRRGLARALGHAAACAGAAVLAFVPYGGIGSALMGLRQVGERASTSLVGSAIHLLSGTGGALSGNGPAGAALRIAGLVALLLVIVHLVRMGDAEADPLAAGAHALAVYLLLTPWFLPWHLLGTLALAIATSARPLSAGALVFSATAQMTASFGATRPGLIVQALVRYGPPLAAFGRARGRPPPPTT